MCGQHVSSKYDDHGYLVPGLCKSVIRSNFIEGSSNTSRLFRVARALQEPRSLAVWHPVATQLPSTRHTPQANRLRARHPGGRGEDPKAAPDREEKSKENVRLFKCTHVAYLSLKILCSVNSRLV